MSESNPLLLDISAGQLHLSTVSSDELNLSNHDLNSSTQSLPSSSFFVLVSPAISMSSVSSTPVSFTMSTPPSSPVDVEQKP
jgi:hypothetical protein